jgi:hypothetical protein
MKMRKLAGQIVQLIESEMIRRHASPGTEKLPPTVEDLRKLLLDWRWVIDNPVIEVSTKMMGARGKTIYLKVGPMVFGLMHNWESNPDGINRFLLVLPLYGFKLGSAGRNEAPYYHGLQDIPIEICADAMEAYLDILAALHNATP